jgi:membrane fusion protein, multidrug efflux system
MLSIQAMPRFPLPTVIFAALVMAACSEKEAPSAAPPPPAVTVVTLKSEEVTLRRELPGRVNAFLIAEVRPQVNGIVKQQLFTEGSQVKAGQPLYQLDDATYQADVELAKANLKRAQATVKSAELTAKRTAELVKINAVSRQDNENAAAALAQSQADVAAAKAELQSASVTLGHARITSPISGYIGKSTVTRGALVTANQVAPLATVQQLDKVYVDLSQSSSELLELRQQLAAGKLTRSRDVPVQILLEDGSTYAHEGKMAFTDISVDPSTGSYMLRVNVPNPDQILLPGAYVRALIGSGTRENALLVPQQGVTRDPKGNASAMVVNPQGKVEARSVKVSRTIGSRWLVDAGLVAGDRVIVEGLQKIRPGVAVTVTEAPREGAKPAAEKPAEPANEAAKKGK